MEERISAKNYINNKCGEGTKIDADVAEGFKELSKSLENYPDAQDIYELMNDKTSSQTEGNGLSKSTVERITLEEMFSTTKTQDVNENSGKSR